MDYGAIIKKSWHYVIKYKYLWWVGLLVSLTEAYVSGFSTSSYNLNDNDIKNIFPKDIEELPTSFTNGVNNLPKVLGTESGSQLSSKIISFCSDNLMTISIILLFLLALGILITFYSYRAKTGLIAAIDELESGKQQKDCKQVINYGKGKTWRVFCLDLLAGILVMCLATLLALVIISSIGSGSSTGIFLGIIFRLLLFLALFVFAFYLYLIVQFGRRKIIFNDLDVFSAFSEARVLIHKQLGSSVISFLISFALGIARSTVTGIIFIIFLFPAIAIFIFAANANSSSSSQMTLLFIIFLAGFLLSLAANWFINALFSVFIYSYWNLTYRAVEYMASQNIKQ